MRNFTLLVLLLFSLDCHASRYITAREFQTCYAKDWPAVVALAQTMYTFVKEKKSVIFDEEPGPSFSSRKVSNNGFFLRPTNSECTTNFATMISSCKVTKLTLDYGPTPDDYMPAYLGEVGVFMGTLGVTPDRVGNLLNSIVAAIVDAGDCVSETSCGSSVSRLEIPGIGKLAYKERPYFYTNDMTFDYTKAFVAQAQPTAFGETCPHEFIGGTVGQTLPDIFGYHQEIMGGLLIEELRTAPGTVGQSVSLIYTPLNATMASLQFKSPGDPSYGVPVNLTLGIGNTAKVTSGNGKDWVTLFQMQATNLLPKAKSTRSYQVTDNAFKPIVLITSAMANYATDSNPSWVTGARPDITVTTTGLSFTTGTGANLVDGAPTVTFLSSAVMGKAMKFDFSAVQHIKAFRLSQSVTTTAQANWNVECSQDGSTFTTVLAKAQLGLSEVQLPENSYCKSIRFTGAAGSTSSASTINDMEFMQAPVTLYQLGNDITSLFTVDHTAGTTDISVNDGKKIFKVTY